MTRNFFDHPSASDRVRRHRAERKAFEIILGLYSLMRFEACERLVNLLIKRLA